ncbi:MFS transporter [Microbacteriaceae bacterium VKM Ac-2855]|nr:MFS transporter [Microbacteriaceae bacterium VKM Ac-2855]
MTSATADAPLQTKRDPLWTGPFVLLLISATFMYLSTFMLTPTLPLFAEDTGAGGIEIGGLIVAAYTLGSLLPRLLWGRLTDTWGRRRVYLTGAAIITIISPLFGVAAILPLIMALRFVQGAGFSASSTAASTMAADLVPATRRSEGLGLYALANTVGMAIGPELGLHMLQQFGHAALFATSAVTGVLAIGIGFWLSYERRHAVTAPATATATGSRLIERSAIPACLLFLFIVMPYGAITAYVAAYGIDRGVTNVGLYFTVFAIALLVVRLGVGRFADRRGTAAVLLPSFALMFAGLIVFWWADGLLVFLVSAVFFGLGYGAALPTVQAAAYTLSPPDRRGAVSATVFATSDIAYGIGAILLGAAIPLVGYAAAFTALAAFVVVALVLYLVVLKPRLSSRT